MPLDVTLPSEREIRIVRRFAAPRQLIWDCHTQPELTRRWLLGPPGWSMPVCVIDLSVGGRYRYVWRKDATGEQFGSFGRHLEIAAPSRLVTTEEMDGLGGQPMDIEDPVEGPEPAVNTLVLTEHGGETVLTLTQCFASQEMRDMVLKSGMTDGVETSYRRIDEIAAEAAA